MATVREIFAPDIVWRIPGYHPLSGAKRGADEVLAFFEQLAKANFKAEVLFLGGNDQYVVDTHSVMVQWEITSLTFCGVLSSEYRTVELPK